MRRTMIAVTTALAALVAVPAALAGPANSTELLSLPTGLAITPPSANDSAPSSVSFNTFSDLPPGQQQASSDGRYIVFTSSADGMSGADADNVENVYVRDLATSTTILVSRADGPTGAPANGDSEHPAISGNGEFVAFASRATNLFSTDTGGSSQVYVRDIFNGTTRLVSRATGAAGIVGDKNSDEPSISDDGSVIAFSSFATNLGGGAAHGQVYVRQSSTTTVVSTFDTMTTPGNADSTGPSISGNGKFVAFATSAALVPGTDNNNAVDVYRRTLANNTEQLASIGAGGVGNSGSGGASIDDDGGRVAFVSNAKNLSGFDLSNDSDIYYHDFGTSDTEIASVGATFLDKAGGSSQASISADGDRIAFLTQTDLTPAHVDTNGVQDVYIRTISGPSTVLASRCANGALLDQPAFQSAIAPSGTRVYFGTASDGCSSDDDNDYLQVFQRVLTLSVVDPTQLISRPTGTGPLQSNTNDSAIGLDRSDDAPQVTSADGRFTTFASEADELAPDDDNRFTNIFVRDALTDTTALVSRASGAGAAGDAPSGPALPAGGLVAIGAPATALPAISANGQVVAFTSSADNLVPGDTNNHADVFVRNLVTNTTTLVSVKSDGSQGNLDSIDPSISADGSRVAFTSRSELDPDDPDTDADVYVRDIAAGTTTLVSRQNGAGGIDANAAAFEPSISGDGNRVGFVTTANNLVPAIIDTNGVSDVYVRDLAANTTTLASARNGLLFAGDQASEGESLDQTGTHVAFSSVATNLVGGDLGGHQDVFVRDLSANTTTLVSRIFNGNVSGNDDSRQASISGDGTRVAFETSATDLYPGDTDQAQDIVLRDLPSATTTVAARADGAAGAMPDAAASSPSLSANGHCLAFDSEADNLVPGGPPGTDFSRVYLRAIDADCGFAAPVPVPQPVPSPGPTPDKKKPVISKLKLTHTKFKVGPSKTATSAKAKPKARKKPKTPIGTTISYTLSEKATVSIVIERKSTGRRKRGKCVTGKSAPKHGVKCSKYVKAGTLKRNGKSGSNKVAFSGRVGSHKLSAGSYRLAVTATDPSKNTSSTHHINFRIVTR